MRRPDEPEKIGIILTLIVIIIGVLVLAFAYIYIEKREALAYERLEVWELDLGEGERFAGCAIDSCPQGIQEWYYKNGGQLYYAKYPEGSKMRMNALFNQVDKDFR